MAMKARTGVLIAVAGVAVAAIAATVIVNVVQNSGDDSKTVNWWVPDWDYDTAVKLAEAYEADNPGVTIELVQTTGDTVANRTAVALDSGNVPDVITESIARVRGYADKGQLADLSDLFGADIPKDDFAPGLVDSLTFDGETYAMPYRWATNALIYNPDLFEAAGIEEPPATWEEFVADAKLLTSGDVVGTAWPVQGDPSDLTLRFLEFAVSGGAEIVDGAPQLTPESSQAAVEMIGGAIDEGWASPSSFELDNTAIRELFLQGRVAMYPGGVFDVDEAQAQGAPIATAVLPGADGPGTGLGVGWAHVVPEASQNLDAAKGFVAYLAEPENMAALTLTFPARISAAEDEKFQTPERLAYAEQLAEYSVPAPNDSRWTSAVQGVHDQIQEVGLGRKSPEEAAESIQQIIDQAFAE